MISLDLTVEDLFKLRAAVLKARYCFNDELVNLADRLDALCRDHMDDVPVDVLYPTAVEVIRKWKCE